ncbi:ribbon-helix-helix protein, CopG family [Natronorubrum sp. JWXQ-INN-674]|uniref:Ribbon-helix-helix protein, CopG family n=2 Tax=Natronorubrum halalkaliphilum TaxID=2691917 RepID=A0A6B0VJV4_9EURY|nr:ribbon-helix-helix protein, CopG family [Natronorubrum halalkaliphilum]
MVVNYYGSTMAHPTFSMPDEMLEDLEERVEEADSNRSRYVREALVARFQAEDDDEWEAPESYTVEVNGL